MTTLISASPNRATLRLAQHFKEDPGVKKQKARLAGENRIAVRDMLTGVVSSIMSAIIYALLLVCCVSIIGYTAHQQNEPWVAIANTIIFALVIPGAMFVNQYEIRWLIKDKDSPLVVHKMRRDSIKTARLAAKRLGSTVMPVLTEDHVASVERVYTALTTASESSQSKRSTDARDHDRITVLLLENINREQALLSIINDRGLYTAKEIEAALRDMESNTVGPVQSGWL